MFNEKELQFINADVDDYNQNIYRQQLNDTTYGISCKLPQGHYSVVFKNKRDASIAHGKFATNNLWTRRCENIVVFNIEHASHLSFMVCAGGSENIVTSLREQALSNVHKLEEHNSLTR